MKLGIRGTCSNKTAYMDNGWSGLTAHLLGFIFSSLRNFFLLMRVAD